MLSLSPTLQDPTTDTAPIVEESFRFLALPPMWVLALVVVPGTLLFAWWSYSGLARLERPSGEPSVGAMALVGLWHEVADTDIDTLLADIYAEHERDAGRPVEHAS